MSDDLLGLAQDLEMAGAQILGEVEKVVFKGAMNIKQGMQQRLRDSPGFRRISHSVDFDIDKQISGVGAEIGPRHGPGEPGNLANIAYFGTSRGGGSVDLLGPFEEEVPRFINAIGDVGKDVL